MPNVLKRFRKASMIKRSFTEGMIRRMRSKSPKNSKDVCDHTTSTLDSSDEAERDAPMIRWERTPSGKMGQAERQHRMSELPSPSCFSNNLILVNRERLHRGIDPLVRCRHLDGIAKRHAQEMAEAQELMEDPICSATMAENVQRGPSIRVIHQMIMVGVSDQERDNILDPRFSRFGMGTATGDDGMIYMSQVFQENAAKRRPTM